MRLARAVQEQINRFTRSFGHGSYENLLSARSLILLPVESIGDGTRPFLFFRAIGEEQLVPAGRRVGRSGLARNCFSRAFTTCQTQSGKYENCAQPKDRAHRGLPSVHWNGLLSESQLPSELLGATAAKPAAKKVSLVTTGASRFASKW